METDAKIEVPELDDGPDQNFETFDDALPMPDWHREELLARLAEYGARRTVEGREWPEVRADLLASLARARQPWALEPR